MSDPQVRALVDEMDEAADGREFVSTMTLDRILAKHRPDDETPYLIPRVPRLEQDDKVQMAYVYVGRGKVVGTLSVHRQLNVDIDADGNVVGIEIFGRGW